MVFLADLLKGILAVIIGSLICHGDFLIIGITAVWAVIGHNFNVFFGLKGGRGLATTTGIFFALNPYPVIAWGFSVAGKLLYNSEKCTHSKCPWLVSVRQL